MFQTYKRPRRYVKRRLEPYVSINARLEIVLNRAAHELLEGANLLEVWYEPETRVIKLKWHTPGIYNYMFPLRRYGRGKRSRIIRAGRLLRPLGLTIDQTLVFTSPVFGPGILLMLDLSTAELIAEKRGFSGAAV